MLLRLLLVVVACSSPTLLAPTQTADIGYFWHITDMHWDPSYNSSTYRALSCNPVTPEGATFGRYGDYRCDPPWRLMNDSVAAMRRIKEDVDFLIWTGDDTPHIWDDTVLHKVWVERIISDLTALIMDHWPTTRVYSALGNHDYSPKSQLPPHTDPLYDRLTELWAPWLHTDNLDTYLTTNETFRKGAYYTMKQDAIHIVVLNTNLHYNSNRLTEGMPDPANQLQWLDDVLTQAAADNEKVMLIAHIPPGQFEKHLDKNWFYPTHNELLLNLLDKHQHTVQAAHMAHHHTDSFRVLRDSNDVAVSSLLLAPSVTPWETTLPGVMGGAGNNPSIRLIQYDRLTGVTLDVHQYWMNLTEANMAASTGNDLWRLEYKATDYFEVADMSTASLDDLADRLSTDDELFDRYYRANGVNYDPNEQWTAAMRQVHVCSISSLRYDQYASCMLPPAGTSQPPQCPPDISAAPQSGRTHMWLVLGAIVVWIRFW